MSLIKRSDVKNHLSPRFRTKIHLCQPESQPDATGFSGGRTGRNQSKSIDFCRGFRCGTFVIRRSRRAGRSFDRFHPPSGAHRIEKRASVKPHSVFLRKNCILPDRLDPLTEPVGENWKLVEEITAPVLDTMIRQMGWHFLWVLRPCREEALG